jgi:hypothetical protein
VWGEEQKITFNKLKVAILPPPALHMDDFSKPFILHTDASKTALRAVLSKEFDSSSQPKAYMSHNLNTQESVFIHLKAEMSCCVIWCQQAPAIPKTCKFLLET